MKKLILSTFPMLLVPILSFSQVTKERDVVGSAGNHSSTASMEVSWTVGEVAINASENPNLIVSEGFQQADNEGVGLNEETFSGEISVYPNPVDDELFYEIQTDQSLELTGALFDAAGRKVLEIPRFTVEDQHKGQLDLRGLSPGKWVLKFYAPNEGTQQIFNVLKVE